MTDAAMTASPRGRVAPPLFALAIFTSAALVFVVQPMVTKLVLPSLGGSAAVWNTAMVFFQAALLLGYAYAHALQRIKSIRKQLIVHLVLLVLAALTLPLHITGMFGEPDSNTPILWLLAVLAVSIGAPFAVLSATAPLLQAWYARVRAGHEDAKNPYVLYAASNLGSFIALLAYPVVVEPLLALKDQTLSWSIGYGVFFLLAVILALNAWGARAEPEAAQLERSPPIPWKSKILWVFMAAIPSSLMLGVTQHLTTDVASAPFLWVIPLALYLLTFVIAFSERPLIPWPVTLVLQAIFVSICAWMLPFSTAYWALLFVVHLGTFFFTALMCHQGLAARRPPPDRLTEFYLLLSLGGVLGGSFNALLAPVIFDNVREYPLVLLLALFARPQPEFSGKRWLVDDGSALAARGGLYRLLSVFRRLGVLLMSALFRRVESDKPGTAAFARPESSIDIYCALTAIVVAVVPTVMYYALRANPELYEIIPWSTKAAYTFFAVAGVLAFLARKQRNLMILALVVLTVTAHGIAGRQDWVAGDRSFFGVLRVAKYEEPRLSGDVHTLMHGTTLHGAQVQGGPNQCLPMLYYAFKTPLGQAMHKVQQAKPQGIVAGVVGLGTGAMASYIRPQDRLTYYEIDPLVERMSRGPNAQFTFIDRCAEGVVEPIVMGDARLSLAKEPPGKFDILIIDAFSSDAVPTHLLTVEAIRTYLRALKPDGVVVLHLSNRNLEITKPAIAAAAEIGAPALFQVYYEPGDAPIMAEASTEALLLSPTPAGTVIFAVDPLWEQPEPTTVRPWTDDYTNLVGSLWRDLEMRWAFITRDRSQE